VSAPLARSVDRLDERISARITELLAAAVPSVAPAAALVIHRDGEVVLETTAGNIAADNEAHDLDAGTLFDLASLTKLVTTTAFLGLVGEGRVGLEDAVGSVVPELVASGLRGIDGGQEPLSRQILPTPPDRVDHVVDPGTLTFRQLLTHTSGLAPWRTIFQETGPVSPPEGPDGLERRRRRAVAIETIGRYAFVARPGTEVHYSDLGFMLLGESVERLVGVPLDEALRRRVTGPLGLGSMTFLPLRAGHERMSIAPTSIDDDYRGRRLWGEVEDENAAAMGGVSGHAGLFATAGDVARLGQAWLSGDPRLGIDPALANEAIRDQTRGLGEARGLGWQVQPTDHFAPLGPRSYGHTGFTGTSLVIDPDRGLVVTLLTNRVFEVRTHPGIDELRVGIHEAAAAA
jgi:CubicO group peptidase (beta-lactamase class C family)